jgi:hypothetical protein
VILPSTPLTPPSVGSCPRRSRLSLARVAARLSTRESLSSARSASNSGLHVGPVEGARKHAKARGDEYDQNGLHRHRSNSIRLIDAIMLDLGLQVDLESAALLRMTASALPKIKYLIR